MLVLVASRGVAAGEPEVIVLPTTGIVDQGMAKYLADGIASAERDGRRGGRHQAEHARAAA